MRKMQSTTVIFLLALLIAAAVAVVPAQTEPPAAVREGFALLQREDFNAAYRFFAAHLGREPGHFEARLGLSIALIGLDKYPEASREIAKLLAKAPNDAKLLEMAARCFWQQKRFNEAEKVLQRRLAQPDARADLWAFYGDALDAQKKAAEAVAAYEKAVSLNPDSNDLRYALGSHYWKQFRNQDAERQFLEILRRAPGEPRASFNLGDIYLAAGDAAKARPLLETAVKNFPREFDTRFALGRTYLLLNQIEPALVELEAAVKLRPDLAEGFYQLGVALQKAGRREEAKAAFLKTQELRQTKLDGEAVPLKPSREP